MNINEIVLGSKFYRTKGVVRHVGIALMNGRILHITPNLGVELTNLYGFAQGQLVTHNPPNSEIDSWALERRASELLNNKPAYRWWAFNCEHLASYVQTGQKISSQLQACLVGAAVHLTMSKKPSLTGVILSAFGGLIVEHAIHSSKKVPKIG